ncbi:diaminopimelate epimerase [Legionella jordanis]|uniref:Diaminopimelate epimerase n=1 Tax=Legionella jordanis TaxID=456 RepID=A0A0W0VBX4_9GAMM|nr:diaminopimelate epimerase [Legionella jordanis]KTD17599.1 diaminopimelate epimerase [Legionella jordanis]RMX00882.1 diaminopimelate epimerase [Legionella jordanis]RMX17906.1 diaminopimelate epimerase [Legionella jordanis]VEH11479.1 diaminopimelate epimerase [Legionella jordanis]HAT8714904.1 diaminopimelate epimerase [Legionella jordanis]
MTIRFTKMHGLGNDFMVIDAVRQTINVDAADIANWAKRDTGIGFDQCLIVEPSPAPDSDFFYRIFNANGQEVGQCGNGARCLARFLLHYDLTSKKQISVATRTTRMMLQINPDDSVTVDMGTPKLAPPDIPLLAGQQATFYQLELANGLSYPVHALSVGNPHAVSVVEALDQLNLNQLGKEISEHPLFPEQSNAGFMEIINKDQIRLRVYERGCGETKACGSGAVAAAAIARLYYQSSNLIHVQLPGGELIIEWPDVNGPIFLKGPAEFVYEGVLLL